ncbi:MAG: uracil-DNA glycosylase [Flavobacteriales bacterium]
MMVRMEPSWKRQLHAEFQKPYFEALVAFVKSEYENNPGAIFPPASLLFKALDACTYDDVKVVIFGQDPYPTKGHAMGLCFSVNPEVQPIPKSLINIFKERYADLGIPPASNGDLSGWASQGVLLLNSILTVKEGRPGSHANRGWESFTDAVLMALQSHPRPMVFLLWGSFAQSKIPLITNPSHRIITAPHPSPLSAYRGFFGSKPFSQINDSLIHWGMEPIQW